MSDVAGHDLVGGAGVLLVLGAYALLQFDRLDARDWRYGAANAAGAAAILFSLLHAFNLAAFLIEAAWLAISLAGLARTWRAARRRPPAPRSRP